MDISWGLVIAALGLIALIYGVSVRKKSARKFTWFGIIALIAGILPLLISIPALAFLSAPIGLGGTSFAISDAGSDGSSTGSSTGSTATCPIQTTASYAAKDKFSTTSVPGTSYYKTNGFPAVTTAASNLNPDVEYTYWVSNESYYVKPEVQDAACGVNTFVAEAYNNATSTLTGYDIVNSQPVTNGAYNTSLGANARASEKYTYQGTAKKSAMPFGGVLVLEYNSTISSVTCTGASLLVSNPYHVTYSPAFTAHTYRVYGVSADLDDGTGAARTFDCQFQNGATAPGAGSDYIATLIPANYYVSNSGEILLDVEKFANQDNTRTALGQKTLTNNWGA